MFAVFTRRIGFVTILTFQSLQVSPIGVALTRWNSLWSENRAQILVLTAVNTSITVGNEVLARSITSYWSGTSSENGFIVNNGNSYSINRQSLVNIWMTLLTSLLGGVVFFINIRYHRFLFFFFSGFIISAVSQYLSHLIRDGVFYLDYRRLAFDSVYILSIKYFVFELGRSQITKAAGKFRRLTGIRLLQDFATTLLRVAALNLTGFKG